MISNADEYWAEGCQSWFDATIRTDVNDGHNTREKLRAHDPRLSELLCEVHTGEGYPGTGEGSGGNPGKLVCLKTQWRLNTFSVSKKRLCLFPIHPPPASHAPLPPASLLRTGFR